MSLENALSYAKSFEDLLSVVRGMEANITFFGCRCVQAVGYEDNIHMDVLVERVMKIARDTVGFSEQERSFGYEIKRKVDQLYRDGDQLTRVSNFFTSTICSIREFLNKYLVCGMLDTRYLWWMDSSPVSNLFDWHTLEQFRQRTGRDPTDPPVTFNRDGRQVMLWLACSRHAEELDENFNPIRGGMTFLSS